MRHVNIPVFIPHLGCPNQCVFCNQRTISGVREFDPSTVDGFIENALSTVSGDCETQLAFFGGSFTGIDRGLMISLLETANKYIKQGRIKSIRISTRPDYINEEILDILKQYNVTCVELGLQSASDRVLAACRRGHTYNDEVRACSLIKARGLTLGGQMMIGLPGSTEEDEIETAKFIVRSGAREARIYPTVVFRDTELCSMAEHGDYKPLTVDEAVRRSTSALKILRDGGVRVLRIGLCSSDNLSSDETYFAGPNAPAIGEMCEGELIYRRILAETETADKGGRLNIRVPAGSMSRAVGYKRGNYLRLKEIFLGGVNIKEDPDLRAGDLRVTVTPITLSERTDRICT